MTYNPDPTIDVEVPVTTQPDSTIRERLREAELREALIDAVTLYRDAQVNTRQVPDGLNAIVRTAMALVDSWLPQADDVRGILAASNATQRHPFLSKYDEPTLAFSGECVTCGVTADDHRGWPPATPDWISSGRHG